VTPLEIDILLWYHTRAVDYRDGDLSAPAVRDTIDWFKGKAGLLCLRAPTGDGDYRTYCLTDRGNAYVAALTSLPLPVCHWVIPITASGVGTIAAPQELCADT
jgi:hypothetical protein